MFNVYESRISPDPSALEKSLSTKLHAPRCHTHASRLYFTLPICVSVTVWTVYILKFCPNNPIAIVLATVHLGRISGSLPDRLMKLPAGGTIGKPPKVGPAEGWGAEPC